MAPNRRREIVALTRDVFSTRGHRRRRFLRFPPRAHLRIQIPRYDLIGSAHSALSIDRAVDYNLLICLPEGLNADNNGTVEIRTLLRPQLSTFYGFIGALPVTATAVRLLSTLVILWLIRWTTAAAPGPRFLAAGPHFTGCPVP